MRFLLDVHVSDRAVGEALREAGHDVRAAQQEALLQQLADDVLLQLAASEDRILVTFDVRDFPGILRVWGASGRTHAGVILVYRYEHQHFGPVLRGIERALERHAVQAVWRNVIYVISPGAAS